ncbi:hypothetical protein GFS31_23120 [Leptolyngbya sp. BL0902]|nr:hypothetical protein GFS31_23120 [Leptolyngbya sp. BL0902]
MNEAFQVKGMTVYCERQDSCLQIWLTSPSVPAPTPTINYLRRGLKRLQVRDIHSLQVYAYTPDPSIPGWGTEVSLAEEDGEVQTFPIMAPTASDHDLGEDAPQAATDPAVPIIEAEAVSPTVPPEAATTVPDPTLPAEAEAITDGTEAIAASQDDHPMAAQYAFLELASGTPLKAASDQYFKLKALALKYGDRTRVEELKKAFYALKDYWEHSPKPAAATTATPSAPEASEQAATEAPEDESVVNQLETLLRQQRISAQVALQEGELRVSWLAVRVVNSEEVAEQLHFFLRSQGPDKLSQSGIQSLTVSSLTRDNAVVWQTSFPLEQSPATRDPVSNIRRKVSLGLKR